ncbi:Rab3 GTPase-activating protein non-catalytic subunit [Fasciolopsis buskii]|uniref:Rab3 GTPase-activating protein non-catalytic subunit n=1 Tax=Fasciolopsis buskii TaxID=27845 RepID=A0A8E0VHA8_9TREM|nr:Rab3 GTPase-activating protein non-catalytic subunit [Fasciolopsis buski]
MIFGSRSPRSDKHILRVRYDLNGTSSIIPAASVQKASSVKLNLSRALTDQHRESYPKGLVISSDRQWLAMTDNLGRVLLIDGQRERVVRIWKGYRDAELAFYELSDNSASAARDTRCLLIHAPHRRMLELFRLIHGPCLSTWDVDEPARLIPGSHQIIGDFYPSHG